MYLFVSKNLYNFGQAVLNNGHGLPVVSKYFGYEEK